MSDSLNSQGNAPEKTEEVGFCKPPRHTQWKKGQSGNPKGRKKREQARNLHDAIVNASSKAISIKGPDGCIQDSNALEIVALQIVNGAARGEYKYIKLFVDKYSNTWLPEPEKQKTKEDLENEKKNAILLKMLRASLDKFGYDDLALKKFLEILNTSSPPQ